MEQMRNYDAVNREFQSCARSGTFVGGFKDEFEDGAPLD